MLNSITLSSDQETVFLIDNGEAIAFPLDEDNGVLIGLMGGQLSVVSAPDNTSSKAKALPFPLNTEEDQWQLMFIPERPLLHIIGKPKKMREAEGDRSIGSTDVDPGRSIGSTDVDPGRAIADEARKNIVVDLNTQVVHLVKEGGLIKVSLLEK